MPQTTPQIKTDSDSVAHAPVRLTHEHIFKGHSLQRIHKEEIKHEQDVPVWPAVILFVPVTLMVYLYVTYYRKFNSLFRAFFSLQAARQVEREDYRLTRRPSVILSFVYIVSVAFMLYQYNLHYHVYDLNWEPVVQFHVIFFAVFVLYAFKLTVNGILGFVMDAQSEMREYNFNIFLSAQGAGLFLLPLTFCVQYLRYPLQPFFMAAAAVFVLFYLVRLVKGVFIGMETRNFSTFHLFLYLCALEILPLIVLITFLMRLK